MDNLKTTQIMAMIGGAVLLLSTFLDWVSVGDFGENGWDTSLWGLQGIFVALIGLAIGGGVAAQAFGGVTLPDRIMGLDHDGLHLLLGFAAFLITFGRQFGDNPGIGILLGWISAAVIIASAVMDMRAEPSAPPTQF